MAQLDFNFNALTVKINRKNLLLNDWQIVGGGSNNWVRMLIPDDGFSCIGLMASWVGKLNINSHHWAPMFLGKDLHSLEKIYNNFYPDIKPQFQDCQIKEAKQHLDNFLNRANSLGAFF